MKKLQFSGVAVLAVVMAVLFSSFTKTSSAIDEDPLHWFDVSTSEYIDYAEPSVLEEGYCEFEGTPCADGFVSITGTPGNEVPVFESYEMTLEKF